MHIEIQFWSKRADNGKMLNIHHLILTEERLCELAKEEAGKCTFSNEEYFDFSVDKVVCD